MKIKLPNPDDYDGDFDSFLEQLELCVHHAKKSWDKLKARYTPEQLNTDGDRPYISYRVNVLWNNYDEQYKLIDSRKDQDIDIEIDSP